MTRNRWLLLEALLRTEGLKGYGLQLAEEVSKATRGSVVLSQGALYPELRDMERDGLVTSYEADPLPERGFRPRRYYRLTDEGLRVALAGPSLSPEQLQRAKAFAAVTTPAPPEDPAALDPDHFDTEPKP